MAPRRVEADPPPRTAFKPRRPPANLVGADGDDALRALLKTAGRRPVVVEFGAQWCDHCKQVSAVDLLRDARSIHLASGEGLVPIHGAVCGGVCAS